MHQFVLVIATLKRRMYRTVDVIECVVNVLQIILFQIS